MARNNCCGCKYKCKCHISTLRVLAKLYIIVWPMLEACLKRQFWGHSHGVNDLCLASYCTTTCAFLPVEYMSSLVLIVVAAPNRWTPFPEAIMTKIPDTIHCHWRKIYYLSFGNFIYRRGSWSTSVVVMTWHRQATSQYLHQFWLIISKLLTNTLAYY